MPGNVLVPTKESGLPKASVVNVTQVFTADRPFLRTRAGKLKPDTRERADHGLTVVLGLI